MEEELKTLKRDGKRHIGIGAGLGVLSIGALATFGALACPFCVVACPAYVASGVIKLKRAKRAEEQKKNIA